eukprot:4469500-Heterocapsa_arctica.AAC.1
MRKAAAASHSFVSWVESWAGWSVFSPAGTWSQVRLGSAPPAAQAPPRPSLSSGSGSMPRQPTCRSPSAARPAALPGRSSPCGRQPRWGSHRRRWPAR